MYSFLLKEKERQKEKGKEKKEKEKKEMDLRGGGGNNNMRMSRLTPGETNGGARDLSLPIRRWQMTLLEIRKDRDLQDLLFLRLRMRGQIFGRLFLVRFEDMMRRALREELHHQLFSYLNLPQRLLSDQNIQARYRLQFTNSVKDPTFTTDQVTDKNGARIEVAIYDSYTGSIISPDCFLSSAKVRITVLDAEFWKNKGENWSGSEFNHSILEERDGKGPILTGGGLTFRLKNGRGTSGSIVFRDNSKWTKSGFRLGVMIDAEGEVNGERVREGVSEPFRVKDRRAKASQKPDLLKLEDKIQGLRSIGKDRASLLEKNNIKTVEDFLWWYYQDQHKLRMILRIKSESDNGWKTMVEHAMTCDYEFQAKYNALNDTSKPQQVSMDKHINIANPNMDQIYVDCPVNSNINSVSSLEEVLHGRILHQDQFSSEALAHMSGWNEPMLPISGLRFVGSGSSEPNPCEHNLINSGYAGPDISLTNGATQLVGLGSSEPNPHENDIIDQGDMSAYYGQLTPICDLSPVNHMTIERGNITNVDSMHNTDGDGLYPPELSTGLIPTGGDLYTDAGSTLNYIWQFLSRSNSFDTGLPVDFTASMSNSVYVGPLSPDRKAKRKALLKWIISPAVKRARIVPPDNQTTVLSM